MAKHHCVTLLHMTTPHTHIIALLQSNVLNSFLNVNNAITSGSSGSVVEGVVDEGNAGCHAVGHDEVGPVEGY